MKDSDIRQTVLSDLNRQYKTIAIFVIVLTGILSVTSSLGPFTALAFVLGAVCSAITGYVGMSVAVRANVRTAQAAKTGLHKALVIAFRGGAVMGMSVIGLALLSILPGTSFGFTG